MQHSFSILTVSIHTLSKGENMSGEIFEQKDSSGKGENFPRRKYPAIWYHSNVTRTCGMALYNIHIKDSPLSSPSSSQVLEVEAEGLQSCGTLWVRRHHSLCSEEDLHQHQGTEWVGPKGAHKRYSSDNLGMGRALNCTYMCCHISPTVSRTVN